MKKTLLSVFVFIGFGIAANANVIYVNNSATGNNDGSSWADAYTSAATAITSASSGDSVFIATGTFISNTQISIPSDVSIFGGFPNSGNPTFLDRDWEQYPVVFSGDFNQDDVPGSAANRADNATRIFVTDTYYVLDGITIQNGGNYSGGTGAGIAQGGSTSREGVIRNCIFRHNIVTDGVNLVSQGGAIRGSCLSENDTLLLENNLFYQNAAYEGGAIVCQGTTIIKNCKFVENLASERGGAIMNFYDSFNTILECTNTLFARNFQDGAVSIGGAGCIQLFSNGQAFGHESTFLNCTFSDNLGVDATPSLLTIHNNSNASYTNIFFTHCIFDDEQIYGPGQSEMWGQMLYTNIEFQDFITSLSQSDFESGLAFSSTNGPVVIYNDQNFSTAASWAIEDYTTNFEYILDCNSPGVDMGNNGQYSGSNEDPNGNPRISGQSIDYGAFETQFSPTPVIIDGVNGLEESTVLFDNYQWYLDGNPIAGATSSVFNYTQNGDYYLVAYNNNTCISDSMSNTITIQGVGLTEASGNEFTVYPNPVKGQLHVKGYNGSLHIFDLSGKLIFDLKESNGIIDVSALETGTYILILESEKGNLIQRFVKE